MDLLDRYLAQVARRLPAPKRADITAELREEIESRLEARLRENDESPREEDIADILRALGDPQTVAARYGALPQLLAPDLVPLYWACLRVVVTIALILTIAGALTQAIVFGGAGYWTFMAAHWELPLLAIGFITVGFIIVDRFTQRRPREWDPRQLRTSERHDNASRLRSVSDCAFNVAFLLALMIFVAHWGWVYGRVWHPIYEALLASSAVNAVASLVSAIWPKRVDVRLLGRVVANGVNVVGISLGLQGTGDPSLRLVLALFLLVSAAFGVSAVYGLLLNRRAITARS